RALDDAHADRRHAVTHGRARQRARLDEGADGIGHRDEASRDGCGPRAPVRLDDVAVHPHRALAQLGHLDHRSQRPSDQTLDLLRAATRAVALAIHAGIGGTRQHAVFRRHPAFALALQKGRDLLLDRGRAEHLGIAELDEHRPFRVPEVVASDANRTEVARRPPVAPRAHREVSLLPGWLWTVRTR